MIPDDDPDRSHQYQDASPPMILKHLNAAWKQLRLFERAVADRDRNLDQLHHSISERDATIVNLHRALKLTNRLWPLAYAFAGGLAAGLAEYGLLRMLKVK